MKRHVLSLSFLSFVCVVFAQAQSGKLPFDVKQPVFKKDTLYITRYGAKADGITLNTTSINTAPLEPI